MFRPERIARLSPSLTASFWGSTSLSHLLSLVLRASTCLSLQASLHRPLFHVPVPISFTLLFCCDLYCPPFDNSLYRLFSPGHSFRIAKLPAVYLVLFPSNFHRTYFFGFCKLLLNRNPVETLQMHSFCAVDYISTALTTIPGYWLA